MRVKAIAACAMLSAGLLARPAVAVAETPKHLKAIPQATFPLMAARDTHAGAPILVRIFKKESELEIWKKARSGRFVHLKTFPICRWSGQLGPKTREGDRQAPEGFYTVPPGQMNPNSSYHLSFDLGYPNAFDRAHGRTGSALMVHGTCSSMGCFAMTDGAVSEIYALAREAFAGGQAAFQVQAFPFRMSAANMAKHRTDPHIAFWRQLKEGSDRFEATGEEPVIRVADGRYAFAPFRDEAREAAAKARIAEEGARVAALVEEGAAAVRTTYADGGQHPTFRVLARLGSPLLGEISRPEALALAGREVVTIPGRARTMLAVLPPARDPSLPGAPPRSGELSVFAFAPLGYGALWPSPSPAAMAGAFRILPGALSTTATYRLASR